MTPNFTDHALPPHLPRSRQLYPLLHACFGQACHSSMRMLQRIDKQSENMHFHYHAHEFLHTFTYLAYNFAHGKTDLAVADAITSTRIR